METEHQDKKFYLLVRLNSCWQYQGIVLYILITQLQDYAILTI